VPTRLQRHWQLWRGLREAWRTQSHVRAPCGVVLNPLVQETPQVVLGARTHEVQAFPPERAQEPLTQGMRLGTPHWGLEDS
jgi:hypothetical protein